MGSARGAPALVISDDDRRRLESLVGSPSVEHRVFRQALGLLLAADGVPNEEIGRQVRVSANTVRAWRAAFPVRGVEGVGVVAAGRGRKPWLAEGVVARVVEATLTTLPEDGSTHWTTRLMARKLALLTLVWVG